MEVTEEAVPVTLENVVTDEVVEVIELPSDVDALLADVVEVVLDDVLEFPTRKIFMP